MYHTHPPFGGWLNHFENHWLTGANQACKILMSSGWHVISQQMILYLLDTAKDTYAPTAQQVTERYWALYKIPICRCKRDTGHS